MNKQEAIERIESSSFDIDDTDLVVGLTYTKSIINQINEPEKVVVPKFVADWVDDHKGYVSKWDEEARADFVFMAINDLFRIGEGIKPLDFTIDEKVSEWMTENTYKFITAILFDYTVEKEKLYTVEIPNPNSAGGKLVLFKQQSTGRLILDILNSNNNKQQNKNKPKE
jgi:hypothetical protein